MSRLMIIYQMHCLVERSIHGREDLVNRLNARLKSARSMRLIYTIQWQINVICRGFAVCVCVYHIAYKATVAGCNTWPTGTRVPPAGNWNRESATWEMTRTQTQHTKGRNSFPIALQRQKIELRSNRRVAAAKTINTNSVAWFPSNAIKSCGWLRQQISASSLDLFGWVLRGRNLLIVRDAAAAN